ncbi:hypothetical protein FRC08_013489 [Ceratobasidium sp. 394]|nr:hypothetical protein FRC08_013489 [Ceratobasidium sp. 394]
MVSHFWGFPAPDDRLISTARSNKLPFSKQPGHACSLPMADLLFDRLEVYGPLRVMSGGMNGNLGVVFVLGRDDCTRESIPSDLIEKTEEVFRQPLRMFTWDEQKQRFTAPHSGTDEVDLLTRRAELRSNLRPHRRRE